MKRLAIRAHGSKDPEKWFSGGLWLLQYFHEHADVLDGEIVVVISPFSEGSTAKKTELFNIQSWSSVSHVCLTSYTAQDYQKVTEEYAIDLHVFSGWLKLVKWLDPTSCVNIHPGPIQEVIWPDGMHWVFGGKGMWGDHVHRKVWEAYQAWALTSTAITMHYMTEQFDDPRYLIGQCIVPILETDSSWEELKKRLRELEPRFQQYVCHQLANGKIRVENEEVVIDDEVRFDGAVFGEFREIE